MGRVGGGGVDSRLGGTVVVNTGTESDEVYIDIV